MSSKHTLTDAGNDLRTAEGRLAEYESIYASMEGGSMTPTEAKTRLALIGKIEETMNAEESNRMMGL